MPAYVIELDAEKLEELYFLSGKMGEPPAQLAAEVFAMGLKHMTRTPRKTGSTLGDAASKFKNWLEFDQSYSNNTARTQSSLLRKILKTSAKHDLSTIESDPMYIAGTMSQPANARRAWQLWQVYCTETEHPILQLEA